MVGNELLSGHTQDANGPYMAGRLRELGHRVLRITIVPDVEDEIVRALNASARFAELIFVCGGLGPTQDDVTAVSVARFLDRDLATPEAAKEQIRRIYRYGKEAGYLPTDEVDEDAWRMAQVPEGGTVVRNDAGAAPGSVHTVETDGQETRVFVLPGPPAELESVFGHMVDRELIPVEDTVESVREVHLATFEAPVARTLEAVAEACPGVQMGSYPQHGEKRVIVRFLGDEAAVDEAVEVLRAKAGDMEIAPDDDAEEAKGHPS